MNDAAANHQLVQFHNVSYSLPNLTTPILSDLNLSVARGETLVLLGESGCGKTTTLKLVNRLLVPTGGEVVVEGKSTSDWDPIALRRRIGYVIQEGGLFPHFTIGRNVGLVPSLLGWEPERIDSRVRELLELVGLEPRIYTDRYPRELSGGQRQRAGVARALAADPPLLLLDEPFGALDPLTRASLQREFGDLARRLGKTAILVTHDVREALLLGARIGLMHRGQLLLVETPDRFLNSDNPQARAYLDTLTLTANAGEKR
jgi:osmoprotectant transport system ATP-binding protein